MTNKEAIEKLFNDIIIRLTNINDWVNYYDLEAEANVPDQYKIYLWNKFWNASGHRLIDGQIGYKKRLVKINQYGLDYADKLETRIFETTGISIFDNPVIMDINETCKLIFDKHKTNGGSIIWTKETFKPNAPRNLYDARDILLAKGVIIPSTTDRLKTILAPKVINVDSYEAAERALENEANKYSFQPTSYTDMSGNSGIIMNHSSAEGSNISNVTATPKKKAATKNQIIKRIAWLLGLIASLIAIYEFFIKSHIN